MANEGDSGRRPGGSRVGSQGRGSGSQGGRSPLGEGSHDGISHGRGRSPQAGSGGRVRPWQRMLVVGVLVLIGATIVLFLALYGRDALTYLTGGRRVQQQAARLGPLSPVVCIGLVVVQQLSAVIPAEPVELAAGYAFGFWQGALVCLAGSVAGALAIMGVVRLVGDRALRVLVPARRVDQLERFGASPRFELVLFVYFLVPGLPKDVMTYAAALSGMPARRVVLITTVGRIPSIAASTLASSLAADGDWRAAGIVLAVIVALVIVGALAYARVRKRASVK